MTPSCRGGACPRPVWQQPRLPQRRAAARAAPTWTPTARTRPAFASKRRYRDDDNDDDNDSAPGGRAPHGSDRLLRNRGAGALARPAVAPHIGLCSGRCSHRPTSCGLRRPAFASKRRYKDNDSAPGGRVAHGSLVGAGLAPARAGNGDVPPDGGRPQGPPLHGHQRQGQGRRLQANAATETTTTTTTTTAARPAVASHTEATGCPATVGRAPSPALRSRLKAVSVAADARIGRRVAACEGRRLQANAATETTTTTTTTAARPAVASHTEATGCSATVGRAPSPAVAGVLRTGVESARGSSKLNDVLSIWDVARPVRDHRPAGRWQHG